MVLTTLLAGSQGVGLTRMNIPYILGTMFTANRDRAKVLGVGLHIVTAGEIRQERVELARGELAERGHRIAPLDDDVA